MAIALTSDARRMVGDNRSQWGVRLGGPALAMAGIAASQLSGPTLCPVRLCTGHACPGCGVTRAVGAAVRGDLGLSFRFHPLALLIAIQLLAAWAFMAFGRPSAAWQRRLPMLIMLNAVALIAVWAVRWRLGLLEFVVAN